MSDEQQDIEETSPQPLATSKSVPLYQPDEFQEYLTLDASPLPPANAPSFLHVSNAHPASSSMPPLDLSSYRFEVDQYGNYNLYMYVDRTFAHSKTLLEGASPNIKTGTGQMNVLTVIAVGNNIYLYANSHILAHTDDNTFSIGEIGLAAVDYTNPTDVGFQQA